MPTLDIRLLGFVRSLEVGRVYTAGQIQQQASLHGVVDLDYWSTLKSVKTDGLDRRFPGSCTLDILRIKDLPTRAKWRCWVLAHDSSDDD